MESCCMAPGDESSLPPNVGGGGGGDSHTCI